jgi:hypothetical protein
MSFGFSQEIPEISVAIRTVELERKDRILFFAAASNSGANQHEMFPATHDSVISIRETNSLGAFVDTNPPADWDGPTVYGTLGKDVPAAWLHTHEGELSRSGTSVSTPIAAGIAAIILSYANLGFCEREHQLPSSVKRLWTRRGMLAMFNKISVNMGNRCFFLSPWKFFSERDAQGRWAAMIDSCS